MEDQETGEAECYTLCMLSQDDGEYHITCSACNWTVQDRYESLARSQGTYHLIHEHGVRVRTFLRSE